MSWNYKLTSGSVNHYMNDNQEGTSMIKITQKPVSPTIIVDEVKTNNSGCTVTYVGLIRDYSRGKLVFSVEYEDTDGNAENKLREIASEIKKRWQINNLAILLYTHSWIEDTEQFLNEYFKDSLTKKEIRKVQHMIEENMRDTDEDNLLEAPYYWWPRWGGR